MTAATWHMQKHVRDIRRADVIELKKHFPTGSRVLEIGGGNGLQASVIVAWGCDVSSIDIAAPPMGEPTFFPVQLYDGSEIPFPDQTFDIVYSSCVLEHVRELVPLLAETRRVLKPDGRGIHIVPSAVWRFWTSVAHYPYLLKRALGLSRLPGSGSPAAWSAAPSGGRSAGARLRRLMLSGAHGEYPSALSELYFYSRRRWSRVFTESGFPVQHVSGNGLFHTGYHVFPFLRPGARRVMAVALGSSTHVFAVRQR